jgi:DNA-binding Lrp family transcriptional regulator
MSPEPDGITARLGEIDTDILREMFRSRDVTIAGIDPRLSANRIASRLKVSRASVDSRLKSWTKSGFLRRFDVWPNPALVNRIGFTVDVRVSDRLVKDEVFRRVELVDGAVGGIDLVGDWVSLQFVVPNEPDIRRTTELLRGIAGIAEVEGPLPWERLEPEHQLTPLDRRIVRVLRRYPTSAISAIARAVGVSTRTITTRYGRLLDDLAVWFVPEWDFRVLTQPVALVNLFFQETADPASVSRSVRKAFPQSLEFVRVGFGPKVPERIREFFLLLPSPARVEEAESSLRRLPGVKSVEFLLLIRTFSFRGTFDRLLAENVHLRPATGGE